jgi:pimeloyl-ACP methyl ester carboxylesterase
MIPTAELLAPDYRVYALDLLGYGESDKPEHVLDLPQLADVLCRWMDAVESSVQRCSATPLAAR